MKSMKLSRGCLFKKLMKRQKLALLQEARPPSKAIEHAPRLLCAGELLTGSKITAYFNGWIYGKNGVTRSS
ncbi:hypothetical protein COV22_02280 [Candidatus Woesearchaeota archaeon CG10_big_fil_rev_8_21_14_0_10_47_5]|nr:MAG: hypothetical protein COV22_02280 [Candidatus Woesearchaeota archaeon CG10_big_fil_rev_8_21_14_0_10_47_5]